MIYSELQNQLELLPLRPGIYKFIDKNSEILYVGKATNLSSRVRSYFSTKHQDRPHIIPMIPLIKAIETIETDNELEALVLESALIKQYMPKYNVELKDDKSYAWIYISTRDEVPRISVVRTIDKSAYNKGRLFGPYPNGRAVRQIFRYIRTLHPFCTCKKPKEPCLYFRMGMCNHPAFSGSSSEEYKAEINQIIKFLQGGRKRHIQMMERKMRDLSSNQQYEEAARVRDRVADLNHLGHDITFYESENDYVSKKSDSVNTELEVIAREIGLEHSIERIECYDVSNIQGTNAFCAMTVSINGEISPSHYRAFKIKSIDTPDDYQMMREALSRRLKYLNSDNEIESFSMTPQIILIDGGKGHLSAVADLVPSHIKLVGISKGRSNRKKGLKLKDQFWLLDDGVVASVRLSTPRILIRIRDEAHRFSLKHHRRLRSAKSTQSQFDLIPGIGGTRKKALLKRFGSWDGLQNATFDEILEVLRNSSVSKLLFEQLQNKQK